MVQGVPEMLAYRAAWYEGAFIRKDAVCSEAEGCREGEGIHAKL